MKAHIKLLSSVFLGVMVLLAIVSVGRGIQNALNVSQDFSMRWLNARLILAHENPFAMEKFGQLSEYARQLLASDKRINFCNGYFPSSGLFFLPFALLSFEGAVIAWVVTNILMTVLFLYLCFVYYRRSGADPKWYYVLSLVFLCSTPYRVTIGNGQPALAALTFFIGALLVSERPDRSKLSGLLLALSMIKYHLIIPLMVIFIYKKKWKPLAVCALIHAGAHLFLCYWMRTSPVSNVLDIFKISENLVVGVQQNISIDSLLVSFGFLERLSTHLEILCLLILFAVSIFWFRKSDDDLWPLGFIAYASLATVYHRIYDYSCLFFLAAFLLTLHGNRIVKYVGLFVCGYFFFVEKIFFEFFYDALSEKGIVMIGAFFYYSYLAVLLVYLRKKN